MSVASVVRATLNKVFPDHWSFMLGEIALYSFVLLILTGTFLAFFFTPSSHEIIYQGSYVPLDGITVSEAYNSTLDLSFDVRGGLLVRQMHHWSANLFVAAIVIHMLRIFFTGAYRRPRESNWLIGILMFWLAFVEGFCGYSLPDDGLSGTGLRIADAIMLSIPVVGTWLSYLVFGGEFPGTEVLGRMYITHVFLIPGLLAALIAVHLLLVVRLKHTQWAGPGRTERNVVGERMVPGFACRSTGLCMTVFAVMAFMGGFIQINPVWLWGPWQASAVTSASQPDWYVFFLEGSMRLMPPWEIRVHVASHGYTVSPIFWPAVVLPGAMTVAALLWPPLEKRLSRDRRWHNLLDRPRDNPGRTALGAMAVTFYLVLTLGGIDDVIADKFHISLNAITWAGRMGVLLAPPLAFYITRRMCLWLQQHDRQVLAEGIETGLVVQDPDGSFSDTHQSLGAPPEGMDALPYRGAPVPKRATKIGIGGPASKGFFVPVEHPAHLEGRRDRSFEPAGADRSVTAEETDPHPPPP